MHRTYMPKAQKLVNIVLKNNLKIVILVIN